MTSTKKGSHVGRPIRVPGQVTLTPTATCLSMRREPQADFAGWGNRESIQGRTGTSP
jgi:hypothetical protein